jgi:hypothetical protein
MKDKCFWNTGSAIEHSVCLIHQTHSLIIKACSYIHSYNYFYEANENDAPVTVAFGPV